MDKSRVIFYLEKRWGIRTAWIALALLFSGCQSQAIQSNVIPTPTETPTTATLLPRPTIQAPQAGTIVDPESAPTVLAPPWSAPTGNELFVSSGEQAPGFVNVSIVQPD